MAPRPSLLAALRRWGSSDGRGPQVQRLRPARQRGYGSCPCPTKTAGCTSRPVKRRTPSAPRVVPHRPPPRPRAGGGRGRPSCGPASCGPASCGPSRLLWLACTRTGGAHEAAGQTSQRLEAARIKSTSLGRRLRSRICTRQRGPRCGAVTRKGRLVACPANARRHRPPPPALRLSQRLPGVAASASGPAEPRRAPPSPAVRRPAAGTSSRRLP